MDIALVATAPPRAPGIVTPITSTQVQAAAQAQAAAVLAAQSTVDLSPLGRFLSAVSLFQKRMLELQSNPAAAAAEQTSDDGISPLAIAVADLADSANALQASSITGTSDDQSLATLFGQQFAAQPGIDGDADADADADDTGLAAIGLTFGSASGLEDGDVLNVDAAVLQAAFATDPAGATALLSRTATAFGALAGFAPAAIADPSILFDAQSSPFDLQPEATPQLQAQPLDLPQFDNPSAAPFSSDGAFLQELLAETPKSALAMVQAPPPEVAEAIANFEAERALDRSAPALQPDEDAGMVNTTFAGDGTRANPSISVPRDPAANAAAVANANRGATQPVPTEPEQQRPLPAQGSTAQLASTQASRTLDAQDATRDANLRIADTIAAERAANERIANAMAAGRAMLAAGRNTQDIDEATVARAAEDNAELQRLAREGELIRLGRAGEARALEIDELQQFSPQLEPIASANRAPVMPASVPLDVIVPQPAPQPLNNVPPLNNAQQLARDPAIAAAIAAYNLGAGPFAALNGRPEHGAFRPKVIPPVDTVTKVAAIETDAATSESSRPFR